MTSLTLRRLTDTVGAEVSGIDSDRLANDPRVAPSIIDALEQHGVLVFRDLHLEPDAQVTFCERLGRVDYSEGHHPVRGIYRVTLDTSKNASANKLRATFDWHIDGCTPRNGEAPQMATMLTAKAVAVSGGETEFAGTYDAYERLSEQEKDVVRTLRVSHSLEASQRRVTPDPSPAEEALWREWPVSVHPLVWTHRDGRRSLVIGASADHVIGLDREAGRQLLDDLLAGATAPSHVYRHEWEVGDAVIWDNRGVLHRAAPYDASEPREMLRTTVCGDEPIQ